MYKLKCKLTLGLCMKALIVSLVFILIFFLTINFLGNWGDFALATYLSFLEFFLIGANICKVEFESFLILLF
jgi:archaellum biogenesis protein FlaJ (TadC family)